MRAPLVLLLCGAGGCATGPSAPPWMPGLEILARVRAPAAAHLDGARRSGYGWIVGATAAWHLERPSQADARDAVDARDAIDALDAIDVLSATDAKAVHHDLPGWAASPHEATSQEATSQEATPPDDIEGDGR